MQIGTYSDIIRDFGRTKRRTRDIARFSKNINAIKNASRKSLNVRDLR